MKAIGGYFELELSNNQEYHRDAIRLNSGRNALEYILRTNKYRKLYIPKYTCDVLLQPLKKLKVSFEMYEVDMNLEPDFEFSIIGENEGFLYTNYFGLKDKFVNSLIGKCNNLIVDNAQAFYSKPIGEADVFYSPRKFFGVPDGAYAYCSRNKNEPMLEQAQSFMRVEHLTSRIDKDPEFGYPAFLENEKRLDQEPMMTMSRLTRRILSSVDYKFIAKRRLENFHYLNRALNSMNAVRFSLDNIEVPMIYPFLSDDLNLRTRLLKNRVYTPQYWPNVLRWTSKNSLEYKLTTETVFLPIDQRYDLNDMDRMLQIIGI